jgi:hypothetical protein
VHLYEIADRAVVRLLELGVEKARWQLAVLAVIMQALAAFMFALTRFIGAISHLFITFDNAIHSLPPGWNVIYFNRKGSDLALLKCQCILRTISATPPGKLPWVKKAGVCSSTFILTSYLW